MLTRHFLWIAFFLVAVFHGTSAKKSRGRRGIPSCYKKGVTMTQYWIPKEGTEDMDNDGKIIHLTGKKTKKLMTPSKKLIAKVSENTYKKFQMEGTGILENGIMVNLDEGKNTFEKINRKLDPFGEGSNDNPLHPWVSIAANDLKKGTTVYVKKLDGVKLPDGKVHNGCLRVEDTGWSFNDCQIDFFVLQFQTYEYLDNKLPEKVSVVAKNCQPLDYVTNSVKKWAVLGLDVNVGGIDVHL